MNRRTAMLIGTLIAILAGLGSIVLSGLLAAEQRDDRARYERAITVQRRLAGRMMRSVAGESESMRTTLCVRGVDTLASSLEQALGGGVLNAARRLDIEELREVSSWAIYAERYVEQANAGPALPQRMGRTRVPDARPDESDWRAIQPARVDCDGGEAFALFPMDIERTPADVPGNTLQGTR